MKTLFSFGFLLGTILILPVATRAADNEDAKEALQALGEFIGDWKGTGGPDKPKASPKDNIWSEEISWSWRFKGDDAWLTFAIKKGKYFKSGELRFLPEKKQYQLSAIGVDDSKQVFTGQLKKENLILERKDPETREVQILSMNTAAEGARFIYRMARKKEGSTLVNKDFVVATTREGVSLGSREKKNECVVSGGLGTSTVSFKGETFYICCSGCADAFKENPEKYVMEFKAKKKKK